MVQTWGDGVCESGSAQHDKEHEQQHQRMRGKRGRCV